MKIVIAFFKPILAVAILFVYAESMAQDIRVAVASNFARAMTGIAERFEANTGHRVTLIFGSTGKHFAQIVNGAPFDIFFAADSKRPQLLEQQGIALQQSRFTYALGKIMLWSPRAKFVDSQGKVLEQGEFRHLAIANPKLAPYGRAAQEILLKLGLWETLQDRLVRGENIAQTFQFVKTGNAELGFVAYSQVIGPMKLQHGSYWHIPEEYYKPIEQQAVLMKDSVAARAFLEYVRSNEVLKIIRDNGYGTP
jgi:molybdate transport system substrate-binding protein